MFYLIYDMVKLMSKRVSSFGQLLWAVSFLMLQVNVK